MDRSPHRGPLQALGLVEPALGRLTCYLDTLESWSRRVNLTGAASPSERVEMLVAPALPLAEKLARGTLIDVGSGNGSPGLVVALLREDLDVTLLEPRRRRWAFLREAARGAAASPIRIERARHDDYDGEPADTVTVRALALPLSELARLVRPGGQVLVLGRRPVVSGPFEAGAGGSWGPQVHVFRRRS